MSESNTLKTRHMTMIALGGTVGAGLFIGSSEIIHNTGPFAFVTYGLTGCVVIVLMRMLSELATASPVQGSFVAYSRMAFGGLAGFLTGWLYWYFWVIVVGFEAVVAGQLLDEWIPIPTWTIALIVLTLMTSVNLLSVRAFGETEYWFAGIKVACVVLFIIVAALFVFGIWPGKAADFSNFVAGGSLLPNGPLAPVAGIAVVLFSMVGGEIVAIAAADSDDPARSVAKAAKAVAFRVLTFFALTTLLIVLVVPWSEIEPGTSPFITALDAMGVPGASNILAVVILTAILSLLNSGMYTASKLLANLAKSGDAPQFLAKTSKTGVPVRGIVACAIVGYACVALAAFWPDSVFSFLINTTGAIMAFVYISIGLSEIRLRRRWEREGRELPVRTWFFPWLSIAFIVVLVGVLVAMWSQHDSQLALLQGVAACVVLVALYFLRSRLQRRSQTTPAPESKASQAV